MYDGAKELQLGWIRTDDAILCCQEIGLPHQDYREAVDYLAKAPEGQQRQLLRSLKHHLGLR